MSTRPIHAPPGPPDSALAERALRGDQDAFAELFGLHEQAILNVAYRLTGSREDAADITQEAFLRVYTRLPELVGTEVNLAAYLHRTARNLVYDRSAQRAREVAVEDIEPVAGGDDSIEIDPDRAALLDEQQRAVQAANARLPERHRLALALRELQGFSYAAIGQVLDLDEGSVGRLLARARAALRRELRLEQVDIEAMDPACRRRLGSIAALVDGQLDPDRSAELEGHLESCATCRAVRDAFEDTGQRYRSWLPLGALGIALEAARAAGARGLMPVDSGPPSGPADPSTAMEGSRPLTQSSSSDAPDPDEAMEEGSGPESAGGGESHARTDGGAANNEMAEKSHRRRRRALVGALAAGLLVVVAVPTIVATRTSDTPTSTAPTDGQPAATTPFLTTASPAANSTPSDASAPPTPATSPASGPPPNAPAPQVVPGPSSAPGPATSPSVAPSIAPSQAQPTSPGGPKPPQTSPPAPPAEDPPGGTFPAEPPPADPPPEEGPTTDPPTETQPPTGRVPAPAAPPPSAAPRPPRILVPPPPAPIPPPR